MSNGWKKHQIAGDITYTRKIDGEVFEAIHIYREYVTYTKVVFSFYGNKEELAEEFCEFYKRPHQSDDELAVYAVEGWSIWSADRRHSFKTDEEMREILTSYGITDLH